MTDDTQTATFKQGDWARWWDNLPEDALVYAYKRDVERNRLQELMDEIGNKMFPIMVRFDPFRDSNNFTVVINGLRIGDTDDPTALIEEWLKE